MVVLRPGDRWGGGDLVAPIRVPARSYSVPVLDHTHHDPTEGDLDAEVVPVVPTTAAWAATVRVGLSGRPLTRLEKLVLVVTAAANGDGAPLHVIAQQSLTGERSARTALRTLARDGLVVAWSDSDGTERWRAATPAWDGTALPTGDLAEKIVPTPAALSEGIVGDGGVLDGFLEDFPDDPVTAYRFTLRAADELGELFANISKNLTGYLRNAIIARAVTDAGHDEMPSRDIGRLCREAKVLGADGADFVVVALYATASADITGNVASYVIRTARSTAERTRLEEGEDA
jgi:hypothetical protein